MGNVNHILQNVEDMYSADVKITSEKENCFIHFDWKIKEKKDYKLILNGNIRVPLFSYKTDPLCNKIQHNDNDKPEQTYLAWEKLINDEKTLKGVQTLYHLKPEMSPMDPSKVKQKFMSNVTYISEGVNILVNMSVWEGPIATWVGSRVAFDTDGNLHGQCQLNLRREFINNTGHHDLLDWSLKFISGQFVHGKLQGHTFLTTWRGVGIIGTFKDGELHGPLHSLGRKFLFDIEVIKCQLCQNSIGSIHTLFFRKGDSNLPHMIIIMWLQEMELTSLDILKMARLLVIFGLVWSIMVSYMAWLMKMVKLRETIWSLFIQMALQP